MQKYEYLITTTEHKSVRIVADSIKGVLEAIDEEETPILNIFRNVPVAEGGTSSPAVIHAEVFPPVAQSTGCKAFPTIPVDSAQGKLITLSASMSTGWKFEGWFVGEKKVANTLQATIVNQEAGTVAYVAKFLPAA